MAICEPIDQTLEEQLLLVMKNGKWMSLGCVAKWLQKENSGGTPPPLAAIHNAMLHLVAENRVRRRVAQGKRVSFCRVSSRPEPRILRANGREMLAELWPLHSKAEIARRLGITVAMVKSEAIRLKLPPKPLRAGVCRRGHSLTGSNVYWMKDGRRKCKACERIRYAARKRKQNADNG